MSTISKVFTILNLALALFLLGSVASILAYSKDYRQELTDKQTEWEGTRVALNKDLEAARSEAATTSTTNRELREERSSLQSTVQTLTAERDQLRNDNNQLRNDVSGIQASLAQLQRQLADVEARNKDLMAKNDEYREAARQAEEAKLAAENDVARLDRELSRRDQDVSGYEGQLAEAIRERDRLLAEREALEKAGVNVASLIGLGPIPLIEATVSQVGSGFVVLSVGEEDGVQVGYPFDVYRGGDYIGRVVVDKVFPDNAIARISMTNQGMQFRELDRAATRL